MQILINLVEYSLSEDALPSLAFLQSGFNGLDFKNIENTQYKIFDLSDLSEKVIMNNQTYLSSQYVQFTHIDKRVQNSSMGIYYNYNEFFHKLTEEFKISIGVQTKDV